MVNHPNRTDWKKLLREAEAALAKQIAATPPALLAKIEAAMAEPIEVTKEKALRQRAAALQRRTLDQKMAYTYAQARLWHIDTGRPLPRFSNGNYPPADSSYPSDDVKLRDSGNSVLWNTWRLAWAEANNTFRWPGA